MKVQILQLPWTERYFGPTPPWIAPGRDMVIFQREMIIEVNDGVSIEVYRIPVGYISDRASVPKITSNIIGSAGDLEVASYPHDWFYSHGGRLYGKDKDWADDLFYAVLQATPTDIPLWKMKVAYVSVRIGGDGGWKDGWAEWPWSPA